MKNFLFMCLCMSLYSVSTFGDLVDHLRKAEGKTGGHSMRNIDFIYMINLDQRPEKFELASAELRPYGIHPYRFSAVNGWELTPEIINDVGLKYKPGMTPLMASTFPVEGGGLRSNEFMREMGKAYFCHCMERGPIGIALSHLSVLKDAYDSGYETIWVMEDDVQVLSDPHRIPDLIDKLDILVGKENWDVLFTDQDTKAPNGQYVPANGAAKRPDMDCSLQARLSDRFSQKTQISPDLRKISARFGAYSMIIRRSGMRKILEFAYAHKIYLPYDMENYFHPDIQRYSTTYDIVSTLPGAITDNGQAYYKQKNSGHHFNSATIKNEKS